MSVEQDLRTLSRLAGLMDDRFRIPGTPIRFGLDGIIGLVPGLGDGAGALVSLLIAAMACKHGMTVGLAMRMLGNIAIDVILGSVPVIGDIFDFAWKANRRNIRLLYRHHGLEPGPG
jgi:hypothetical protein